MIIVKTHKYARHLIRLRAQLVPLHGFNRLWIHTRTHAYTHTQTPRALRIHGFCNTPRESTRSAVVSDYSSQNVKSNNKNVRSRTSVKQLSLTSGLYSLTTAPNVSNLFARAGRTLSDTRKIHIEGTFIKSTRTSCLCPSIFFQIDM